MVDHSFLGFFDVVQDSLQSTLVLFQNLDDFVLSHNALGSDVKLEENAGLPLDSDLLVIQVIQHELDGLQRVQMAFEDLLVEWVLQEVMQDFEDFPFGKIV